MTQLAIHQTKQARHTGRLDEHALETFLVSLSKSELLTLENLLSNRLTAKKVEARCEMTEIEVKSIQSLTARENQVLTLIARGYTRPEVAEVLHITRNTAATHIASIYRKLDVGSIAEATMYAYRWGLVA